MPLILVRRRLRRYSSLIFIFSFLLFIGCLLYVAIVHRINRISANRQLANIRQAEGHNHYSMDNSSETIDDLPWPNNTREALEQIQLLNNNPEVLNVDKFGALQVDNVDFVVVVQVHDRAEYLKLLIESLSRARGIDRVLLMFSSDLNLAHINALIRSIQFCRVVHIFFPFNLQLWQNSFPGHSPTDCPEDAKKNQSLSCADAQFADTYGHYRSPKLSQIKHHWWWKANFLFGRLMPSHGLDSKLLVLLEEDHIVAPDFLYALQWMHRERERICPECEILCLGRYTTANYERDIAKLGVESWVSNKFNMGIAINAALWRKIISNHSKCFCGYDDYNWDWTLLALSANCLSERLRVLYTSSARVVHIGDRGVHTNNLVADSAAKQAMLLFERAKATFFPTRFEVSTRTNHPLKALRPNGGWSDPRDRRLCELNTANAATEKMNAAEILESAKMALIDSGGHSSKSANPTTPWIHPFDLP